MAQRLDIATLAVLIFGLGVSACGPSTPAPACVPGTTMTCVCSDGATGAQACNAAGSGFEACSCSAVADASAPPDSSGSSLDAAPAPMPDAGIDAFVAPSLDAWAADAATMPTMPDAWAMGAPDAAASDAPVAAIDVAWDYPALISAYGNTYFPTYLAHLLGPPGESHPVEFETACATITNPRSTTVDLQVDIRFPGYGGMTTQDVTLPAGDTTRVCVNPVPDLRTLYALRAPAPGRIEVTVRQTAVIVSSDMRPVTIMPGNDALWSGAGVPTFDMFDLATVYALPHDPMVEGLLTDVAARSVFGGFGGGDPYDRPRYGRTPPAIPVGSRVIESFFLESGDSFDWRLESVVGGSAADIDVYLFTPDQYTAWLGGATVATRVWRDQISGATGTFTNSGSASWYTIVFFNTTDNFVSRTIRWSRSNTAQDIAYDALRSIFEELYARGITYVNIPGTYFGGSQHIKLASEILTTRSANCIDGTLLFAGVLELIGMEPVLIFRSGHAYVGVRAATGSSRIWPIETTLVSSGDAWGAFSAAISNRATEIATDPNYHETDVRTMRAAGITPLPL